MILCVGVTAGFKNRSQIGNGLVCSYIMKLIRSFISLVKNVINTLYIISCHNRDCSRDSDAGDHIAYDLSHAINMALPLDSCPDIHGFIAGSGGYLLFSCAL